jgi:hypothetical protein
LSTSPQLRDEQQYLRGWCAALRGDVDKALGELGPLVRSPVLGLGAAIPLDVANIVVANGDSSKAEAWLTRNGLMTPELLDTLAATYVEIGQERDGWEMNQHAIDTSINPPVETQCRRLVRKIVLGPEGERVLPGDELEALATKPKVPNRACVEMHHAVRCWRDPAQGCWTYFDHHGIDVTYTTLLEAFMRWPKSAVDAYKWQATAERAIRVIPKSGAYELAVVALEAAVRADGNCSPSTYKTVVHAFGTVKRLMSSIPPKLQALQARCRRDN